MRPFLPSRTAGPKTGLPRKHAHFFRDNSKEFHHAY